MESYLNAFVCASVCLFASVICQHDYRYVYDEGFQQPPQEVVPSPPIWPYMPQNYVSWAPLPYQQEYLPTQETYQQPPPPPTYNTVHRVSNPQPPYPRPYEEPLPEPVNLTLASLVLKDMDLSVQPCDDFYQFACGGFVKNATLKSGIDNAYRRPVDRVLKIISEGLAEKIADGDPKALVKAKNLYHLCMDEDKLEKTGQTDLKAFLKAMGGWPMLESWNEDKFDLVDLLVKARQLMGNFELPIPVGAIIGFSISRDFKEFRKYTIYIDQPGFGQRGFGFESVRELYLTKSNSVFFVAYKKYIRELAIELGGDRKNVRRDVRDLVDFETELAKISSSVTDRRIMDNRYKKMTISQLAAKYPELNWLRYLQGMVTFKGSNVTLTKEDKIVLWSEEYFDKLFQILKTTPHKTLANYIVFRAMQPLLGSTTKKIQHIILDYDAATNGATNPTLKPRDKFCASMVHSQLTLVTSRLYLQRGFSTETLTKSYKILHQVRRAFLEQIVHSQWLSQTTRTEVIRKMNTILDNLAFPDYVLKDDFIEKYYKLFKVDKKSLFRTMLWFSLQNFVQAINQLSPHPQLDRWQLSPATVNAFHNRGETAIEIPAAIMAEPYFSNDYTWSMNFGGLGFVMGHEYMHAFDVTGVGMDGRGLISPYWDMITIARYSDRAECLLKQYNSYRVPGVGAKVNGNLTLNENLCDLAGLTAGYHAYKRFASEHGEEVLPAGLSFSHDQLYFINAARINCARLSNQVTKKLLLTDSHALPRYRVYGPMQNMPEFAAAFNCPPKTYMNPPHKCAIW